MCLSLHHQLGRVSAGWHTQQFYHAAQATSISAPYGWDHDLMCFSPRTPPCWLPCLRPATPPPFRPYLGLEACVYINNIVLFFLIVRRSNKIPHRPFYFPPPPSVVAPAPIHNPSVASSRHSPTYQRHPPFWLTRHTTGFALFVHHLPQRRNC